MPKGKPKNPKEVNEYVGFRAPKALVERIDAHAKRLIKTTPWLHSPKTRRSDAVRDLLLLALDGLEGVEARSKK